MTDTFHWRLAIGAILIAGGYGAWLIISGSDLTPSIKTALTAVLGATPLLTKLLAIALLGRPTIDFLKKHVPQRFRRRRLAANVRLGSKADEGVARASRSALCQKRTFLLVNI
jgi:hypothetical protein